MRVLKLAAMMMLMCSLNIAWAIQYEQRQWQGIQFSVIKVTDLSGLSLKLNQRNDTPFLTFDAIQAAQPHCRIDFAMNAGMFHADFSPVGLYIENQHMKKPLNTAQQGHGNFLIQPNGVLYWDQDKAHIATTQDYQKRLVKPLFATQSGPMLVVNGKLNQNFIQGSESKKIRNGVGVANGQLWFVLAEDPINFYDFAEFFRGQLNIQQALYLDGGSVPSLYLPQQQRNLQRRFLGPMVIWQNNTKCRKKPD